MGYPLKKILASLPPGPRPPHFHRRGGAPASVTYKGREEKCEVYVVPFGNPIMGLDLMEVFSVNVVDNSVCHMFQSSSRPTGSGSSVPVQSDKTESSPATPPLPIRGFQHVSCFSPPLVLLVPVLQYQSNRTKLSLHQPHHLCRSGDFSIE